MADRLHPAVLMHVAHRHVEARVLDHLAAHGFDDLTAAQARVAAQVGDGGTRLTTLAERAGITKQAAGSLVDALERGGYVTRVADPADARARLVRLAARGEAARERAREVERATYDEWRAALGPERMADLEDALALLRPLVDPWA